MTDIEPSVFIEEDNIYMLSEDERLEYKYKKQDSFINLISGFSGPKTLEQVWLEIENITPSMTLFDKNPRSYYQESYVSNTLTEIFARYHDKGNIYRAGDIAIGLFCLNNTKVDVLVGGNSKITKECNPGFNMFSRSEMIPLHIQCFYSICIPNEDVTGIVYANILDKHLLNDLHNELDQSFFPLKDIKTK